MQTNYQYLQGNATKCPNVRREYSILEDLRFMGGERCGLCWPDLDVGTRLSAGIMFHLAMGLTSIKVKRSCRQCFQYVLTQKGPLVRPFSHPVHLRPTAVYRAIGTGYLYRPNTPNSNVRRQPNCGSSP